METGLQQAQESIDRNSKEQVVYIFDILRNVFLFLFTFVRKLKFTFGYIKCKGFFRRLPSIVYIKDLLQYFH